MNYDSLNLAGKTVVVLGLGDTGLSCARWLTARGAKVSVADSRPTPPQAGRLAELLPHVALHSGGFDDALLQQAELLVISPGVPLSEPAVVRAIDAGVEVVGDVELFARAIEALDRQRDVPIQILAITGSNGKSTVTAMCGDMCRMAGRITCVAGNIGLPVLDALYEVEQGEAPAPQVWVLELSSFQLETTRSLNATAATVLNVTEDHLDRYADMEAYAAAKARIYNGTGVQVVNRDDARSLAMALPGRHVISFGLDNCPRRPFWLVRGRALHRRRHADAAYCVNRQRAAQRCQCAGCAGADAHAGFADGSPAARPDPFQGFAASCPESR